jgi:hypothetical protein
MVVGTIADPRDDSRRGRRSLANETGNRLAWVVVGLCCIAIAGCGSIDAAPARIATHVSSGASPACGSVPKMIQNHVAATQGVSCGQARRLMHKLLGGSKACYARSYTPHPRCELKLRRVLRNVQLEGFRCSATYNPRTNVLKGRCVNGRQRVIGTAGP